MQSEPWFVERPKCTWAVGTDAFVESVDKDYFSAHV
jgi:hypothetical protein